MYAVNYVSIVPNYVCFFAVNHCKDPIKKPQAIYS